jgi:YYY domain-containing protein
MSMEVIANWLRVEGGFIASWWLMVTLCGAAVLPLCARFLAWLPDKGYTLARALGMLLTAFVLWLLASYGLMQNDSGGIVTAWLIVLAVAVGIYIRDRKVYAPTLDLRAWWREHGTMVIVVEVLFIVMLFGWAMVRAHNPELRSTEKPMEMMMVGSILRSDTFPPRDAWLSGYGLSYYYFGYVMTAMLTMVSGASLAVGFNLMNALLFSLTGITAFGIAYNLVRARVMAQAWHGVAAGLLALFSVVLMGNWQAPLIEAPYQMRLADAAYLQAMDTQDRLVPKFAEATPSPTAAWDYWWWFRASRVIQDRDIPIDPSLNPTNSLDPLGRVIGIQPINEFPHFSFILADNHPHVLALPFVLLALGLALNVLLRDRPLQWYEIVFSAIVLGGIVFLNAWDGPIYMGVFVAAELLRRRAANHKLTGMDWLEGVGIGLALVVLTLALYFPFFYSFRSQASGFLANYMWPTQIQQLFVIFGPFLVMLLPFLLWESGRRGIKMRWNFGIISALGLLGVFLLLMTLVAVVALNHRDLAAQTQQYLASYGGFEAFFNGVAGRRISPASLLTTILLLGMIVIVVARLFSTQTPPMPATTDTEPTPQQVPPAPWSASTAFVLLVIGVAVLLVLTPEFIYLRDGFTVRINTVFKFYYQAWLLFSVALAYAAYVLLTDAEHPAPMVLRVYSATTLLVVLMLGAVYPINAIYSRALVEAGRASVNNTAPITLDGSYTMMSSSDDYAAIMCFQQRVGDDRSVLVVEAIGGSYWVNAQQTGKIGAMTGIDTLLGWENHQRQWRGSAYTEMAGQREIDIFNIYNLLFWDQVLPILQRNGVDYVYYGPAERARYGIMSEEKFIENATPVCEFGESRLYQIPTTTQTPRG